MQADTTLFQARHGRQPRGFGRWGFQLGEETLFIVGQYSDSKKKAFKIAQTRGEERVIVLPGKELVPQGGNPERPEKLNQEQINIIKNRLMAQAEIRRIGRRTRAVVPVKGMKAAEIMAVFDIQSKRTAHGIVKRGFHIVDYTKPAKCPGTMADVEGAYRMAKWWLYKKLAGRVPHWADGGDMIQEAVTRLAEMAGDPRMSEPSFAFYVIKAAMAAYLRSNQKHQHEDEERSEAPGSRWGTWDRSYRHTETMCRMIEARGITPMARGGINHKRGPSGPLFYYWRQGDDLFSGREN
jgi:hypothetical protein